MRDTFRVIGTGMGRPVLDDGRDVVFLTLGEVVEELVDLSTGNLEDLVPSGAGGVVNRGSAINGQRTGVVVVTDLTETQGGALQLVVDVDTGNPQGTGVQGSGGTTGGDEVLGTCTTGKVPPHITTRVDTCPNIVDVQPFK